MGYSPTEVFVTQPSRLALFYRQVIIPVVLGLVIVAVLEQAAGGTIPWYVWAVLLAPLAQCLFTWYRVELRGETLTARSLIRTRSVNLGEALAVSSKRYYLPQMDMSVLGIHLPGDRWFKISLILDHYANRRELKDAVIRAAQRANPEVDFLFDAAASAHSIQVQE